MKCQVCEIEEATDNIDSSALDDKSDGLPISSVCKFCAANLGFK